MNGENCIYACICDVLIMLWWGVGRVLGLGYQNAGFVYAGDGDCNALY